MLCHYMTDMRMIAVDTWTTMPARDEAGSETYADRDHDGDLAKFVRRIEHIGAQDRVHIMRMMTDRAAKEVPDGSLDFVFVDADHSYSGCRADIENWQPKIRSGGLLAGHDYEWPSVKRAVRETGGCDALADDNVWLRYV